MSGGSFDYAFRHVENMADELSTQKCGLRKAFAKHLHLVAIAMHDIEWVDSSDYGEGDEIDAIKKALPNHKQESFDILKDDAEDLINKLQKAKEDL